VFLQPLLLFLLTPYEATGEWRWSCRLEERGEREETGAAGGDGFPFGGRRHGHGHPSTTAKSRVLCGAVDVEGGHQKTADPKAEVALFGWLAPS